MIEDNKLNSAIEKGMNANLDDKQKETEKEVLKKEQDKVKLCRERIEASEKYREKVASLYNWKDITEEYKGQQNVATGSDAETYIPMLNYVFAYVKTEIPSLYLRDPKIKVNPKKGSSVQSAKILEKAVNYIWRVKKFKRENKKNILDLKLIGHSWFKTGYTGDFGSAEEDGEVRQFIKAEDFFGYRVDPYMVTFNQDALDPPYDCTWLSQEYWVPLTKVQDKASGYVNAENLKASSFGQKNEQEIDKKDKSGIPDKAKSDVGSAMVRFFEVWDKEEGTKYVICDQCDRFHRLPVNWPYAKNGFGYSYLETNDNPDSAYGIPDVFMFRGQIAELAKVRGQQLDHLKRFNRQLISRKGALSDDSKDQFAQGLTGAVIEAEIDENTPINSVITPIPYPPLPSDIYSVESLIKEDIINVSGQSPQERGATQKTSTRTFRELAQMDKGAKNRRSEQVDTVEDFVEDISGNLVGLLKQFADLPLYVQITGEDEQTIIQDLASRPSASFNGSVTSPNGFTFTKEDIQGEFDIECVAGSTVPLDREQKMQQLLDILNLLPQLGVMPGGPVIATIGIDLAQELDMPEIEDAIKQEGEMAKKQAAKAEEDQKLQTQQIVAQESAKLQLQAEKTAAEQHKLLLETYRVLAEIKQAQRDSEMEAKRDTNAE